MAAICRSKERESGISGMNRLLCLFKGEIGTAAYADIGGRIEDIECVAMARGNKFTVDVCSLDEKRRVFELMRCIVY